MMVWLKYFYVLISSYCTIIRIRLCIVPFFIYFLNISLRGPGILNFYLYNVFNNANIFVKVFVAGGQIANFYSKTSCARSILQNRSYSAHILRFILQR